tara:strand:+ start:80 stop:850 length:771 start_codon:yes stop_codon:yes gene_type:complete
MIRLILILFFTNNLMAQDIDFISYLDSVKTSQMPFGIFRVVSTKDINNQKKFNAGTGFKYDKLLVITNYHVCVDSFYVYVVDRNKNYYKKRVLYRDPRKDLCMIEGRNLPYSTGFKNFKSKTLSFYSIYGKFNVDKNSLKNSQEYSTSSTDFISKLEFLNNNEDYAFAHSECRGGVSGSPLVNKNGLVGVVWGATYRQSFPSPKFFKYKAECFFLSRDYFKMFVLDYANKVREIKLRRLRAEEFEKSKFTRIKLQY